MPDLPDTKNNTGPGSHVRAFSGRDGAELRSFLAYAPTFAGGVRVAAGDIDRDGYADIVTGAGAGGLPHVRAFGAANAVVSDFPAYHPDFRGGVFVATADLDRDGLADVITGAGAGAGPHVKAFRSGAGGELASFLAFAPGSVLSGFSLAPTPPDNPPGGQPPTSVNTAPTISQIDDRSVGFGESTGEISFVVGDAETTATDLIVSATAADPLLFPAAGLVLGGSGATRTLIVTPAAGRAGSSTVSVTVTDAGGLSAVRTFTVAVNPANGKKPPTISDIGSRPSVSGAVIGPLAFTVADPDSPLDQVSVVAAASGTLVVPVGGVTVAGSGANREVTVTLPAGQTGTATITLTATDPDGLTATDTFDLVVAAAPVLTSTADFGAATAFLYTGPGAVQTGVAAGTITPIRAAVLRGKVVGLDGQPLTGVTVTVLGHPEFGQTTTHADGTYDLAVNGGGLLTLVFAKAGFLTVQRQADVDWQDFTVVSEVALTPLDEQVTHVDLASSAPFQMAQGSVETDADGTRQAMLLFPQGVQATMTLADGTVQSLTSLDVRATEYTVGEMGPMAMPGTLPPASGYTYAVELSVDQALQAGAMRVDFSGAVPFYVENFLNFAVGMAVPTGYYDRGRGLWVPSDNGRVIQVLAVGGGVADLDTDGDGDADTAAELAALGVTAAERAQLATRYEAGESLWRVPITHFTPWDCNWPYGPPDGATPPQTNPDELQDGKQDDPNKACGSVIGIENQTLGESIAVTGTPFSLVYQSDRVQGDTADRTLRIPLTQATLPPALKRVELTISVAGRQFSKTFEPSANLDTLFTWDGRDAFDRDLKGSQKSRLEIKYVYDAEYQSPSRQTSSFGALGAGIFTANRARQEVALSQVINTVVPGTVGSPSDIGGWGIDVHHSYDPVGRVLHLGTGEDRHSDAIAGAYTVEHVAGTGFNGFSGDGGDAKKASLWTPLYMDFGPDGSLYFADLENRRVRKISPDGVISTIAGNGTNFRPDRGSIPATDIGFTNIAGIAVGADSSIYVSEEQDDRVYRIRPDGTFSVFAGQGRERSFGGDGGPAVDAKLYYPSDLAVGSDGSVYILDHSNSRIRRVAPDGTISTVAGTGVRRPNFSGIDGVGARAVDTPISPSGIALGPDGLLYFSDSYSIRRVGLDGRIEAVAGKSDSYGGIRTEGIPATEAELRVRDFVVQRDGTILLSTDYNTIRVIDANGLITTVAGTGEASPFIGPDSGNKGFATLAPLTAFNLALSPGGDAFFAERFTIRRITRQLLAFQPGELVVASEDGSEAYRFNSAGRHLQTIDTLTGTPIYTFGYDSAGRLVSVTDADNNVTTIERDASGNPKAIVAPFGQRTQLSVGADGYLSRVTSPGTEPFKLGYAPGGLLTSFTDPRGNESLMTYDAGRLTKDQDPEHGFTALTRQDLGGGSYKVTTTNAVNGTRQYLVENMPDGSTRRTAIDGRGFKTVTLIGTDGSEKTTLPDGTVTTTVYGPDPRFGMLAPVVTKQTVTTPSGKTSTTTGSRTATFTTANDPTTPLKTLTDTAVVNGKTFTTVFNAAQKTVTSTSAEGRKSVTTLDARGRVALVEVPGVLATQYGYDARGRLRTVTQGDRKVTYDYDSRGNLASITDPLDRVTALSYDNADRLIRQTQPGGSVIEFRYDAEGNMVGLTPPGQPEHTFAYDKHDELTATTAPDVGPGDDTTRYVYNLAHQVVRETLPGGVQIDYAYCECGRLTSIDTPWGDYTYAYSATTGVLTSLESPGGFKLTSGYDGILTTSETLTGPVAGKVNWTYDSNFRVVSESVNGANAVTFAYDGDGLLTQAGALTLNRDAANGRLTGTTLGTVTDTIGYNAFGEVATYSSNTTLGGPGFEYAFTRDDLGRITRKFESVGGVTTVTDYGYDAKGQLKTVTENGVLLQTYAYDSNGNRISLTTPASVVSGTYDNQDRLLTYGTKTYTYALDGSLRSVVDSATGEQTDYTYDGFGNLTRAELPDGRVIEYLIDGQNRRVGKKVDGTLTEGLLYDGQLTPVAQLDANGNVVARFVYATGVNVPAYMIKDGETYRLVTDHLGSVRLVGNVATGVIAQQIDYDAFGQVVLDTNPGFQPFGYAGGLYDVDTELVRFGARDYDAGSGRWMAKDPIGFSGEDANTYRYVENSPLIAFDPSGLLSTLERIATQVNFALAGAVAGGIAGFFAGGGSGLLAGPGAVAAVPAGATVGATLGVGAGATAGLALGTIACNALDGGDQGGGNGRATQGKGLQRLQKRLAEHKQKLADYIKNPDAFDNKGFLKNASSEIRQRTIEGRIRHLEGEINTFQNQINQILRGGNG